MGKLIECTPAVARIEQKDSATCWLAACQMLYKWKGLKPEDVETKLAASTDERVDLELWLRAGIDHDDAVPLAKALDLKWGGGGKLEAWQFSDAIRRWGPLLAIGTWNSYSHVVVVSAAEETDDEGKKTNHKLKITNPYPGTGVQDRNVMWFNEGLGHWCGVNGHYMHW